MFLVRCRKRDAPTLESLILQHVKVGSTIITDQWAAYSKLNELGYKV